MKRIVTVAVVVLTVLAGVALPAFGMEGAETVDSFGGSGAVAQTATANTSTDAAPGTRLAGSVGVQGAELGGELESRSLDHRLNQSPSNDSKAAVIAQQANRSQERAAALEAQLEELEAARANGSISEQEYRVRAAQLSARASALARVAAQTSARADALPAETLRRNGVNVTALRALRTNAGELAGPEVAAVARGLAGPSAGRGFGPDRTNSSQPQGDGASPGQAGGDDRRAGADRPNDDRRTEGNATATGSGNGNETATGGDDRGPGRASGQNPGASNGDDARRSG